MNNNVGVVRAAWLSKLPERTRLWNLAQTFLAFLSWLETHRREWLLFPGVEREKAGGSSPHRCCLDTVTRKARGRGLSCGDKMNKQRTALWAARPGELISASHTETHLHRKWPAAPYQHTWTERKRTQRCPGGTMPLQLLTIGGTRLSSLSTYLGNNPSTTTHCSYTMSRKNRGTNTRSCIRIMINATQQIQNIIIINPKMRQNWKN